MIRHRGVCCIVLELEDQDPPLKFKTITYKRFSSLPRPEALVRLGEVIANNLLVTAKAIEYCGENGLCYRLSSSVFPLLTYDKAELSLGMLPNHVYLETLTANINQTRERYNVRVSTHPDQFNVLASDNLEAVERTIQELNFQAAFMTSIGCPLSYESPLNIHVNRSAQSDEERKRISELFYTRFERLSEDARKRLVLENDDKPAGWTVKQLFDYFDQPEVPITFDYLHHKCHPGTGNYALEDQAFMLAYETWRYKATPLFHYSESIPEYKNPRKHADYATKLPNTYNRTIDLDFEFKMKEKVLWKLQN